MTLPVPGSLLSDIITWVRRTIKTPSPQAMSDDVIADYVNRFYIYDMPERNQLFELKRQYSFETIQNIFQYQFPFNSYQTVLPPVYCDGIEIGFTMDNIQFNRIYPKTVFNQNALVGDGTNGPYSYTLSQLPIIRGYTDVLEYLFPYVYVTAFDSSGSRMYIVDDGEGVLNQVDSTFQTIIVPNCGTVDYEGGSIGFTFNQNVPSGTVIQIQTTPFTAGTPRMLLFNNNTISLYPIPSKTFLIQLDAYITPSQFLQTADAIPFRYMGEYIAYGAARKIFADTGDEPQFNFYEKFFLEQECLVLRRTNRQYTEGRRVPTIFSGTMEPNSYLFTQY